MLVTSNRAVGEWGTGIWRSGRDNRDLGSSGSVPVDAKGAVPDVSGQKGETLPPDAAAGHNDPVTGLSADGTFHLLSVRGPLTNQFPRT
jgi:hypothetical protein